jgi:hypothetical protein
MPETMTLDQFNETIPTRDQQNISLTDFETIEPPDRRKLQDRGLLDKVKYFLGELGEYTKEGTLKPLGRFAQSLPAAAEDILQVGLDNVREIAKNRLADNGMEFGISKEEFDRRQAALTPEQKVRMARDKNLIQNMDNQIETSKRLRQNWLESMSEGPTAPSEEYLNSSILPWEKNYSITKMVGEATQSAGMLGLAAAVTAATKSPTTGAAVLGTIESAREFNIAREKGLSIGEANMVFVANTAMLTALETIPLTSFMEGGTLPLRMFKVGAQEGGEEALQKIWVDSVAKLGYDETRKITEGLAEATFLGVISGGLLGSAGRGAELNRMFQEAKKKGADVDSMAEVVGEQLIEHAEEITEKFTEKVTPEAMQQKKEGQQQPEEGKFPEPETREALLLRAEEKLINQEQVKMLRENEELMKDPRWQKMADQLEAASQITPEELAAMDQAVMESFEQPGVEIPDFKGTEEAVEFGFKNRDNPEIIETLKNQLEAGLAINEEIRKIPFEEQTDEQMQAAQVQAFKNQLLREAIQGAEGNLKPDEIKRLREKLGIEKVPEFIDKNLQKQIDQAKTKEEKLEVARTQLQYVKDTLGELKNFKINRAKNPEIAEELADLPREFVTTSQSGLSADEAIDMINAAGMGVQLNDTRDLIDFIENLKGQQEKLSRMIESFTPKKITKQETTILKEKIANIKRGFRLGQVRTRQNIKDMQAEITNLIKKSGLEAKDRAKFLSMIKNANTPENLQKAIDDFERRYKILSEAQAKNDISDEIKKELKRAKPVKKGQKRVAKFDYQSNKLFESLRSYWNMNQAQAQAALDSMPEEVTIPSELIKKRFLSLKANGKESSVELYQQVLDDIKLLKQIGEGVKSQEEFDKRLERKERVDELVEAGKRIRADKKTFKTKVGNVYRRGFSNIYSMLNSLYGKDIAEKYDPILKESNRNDNTFFRSKEISAVAAEIQGLKSYGQLQDLIGKYSQVTETLIDKEGVEYDLTRFDIIDMYLGLKNQHTREAAYFHYGKEQIDYLLGTLTMEDISMADYMQDVVQEYLPILNQRNIEITGRDLGFVDFYWPRTSKHDVDLYDDINLQGETPSAMKERSKGMVKPVFKNAWIKMFRHIHQAEHVDNLSREYETLRRLFTNDKIESDIKRKFGEDVYNTLLDQIDNISLNKTTTRLDAMNKWFNTALGNWVTAKIALNPNVFVKQLISTGNYIENMNSEEWTKLYYEGITNPKETFDFMWNNAPFLEARFNRGYSEALQDAINNADRLNKNWSSWTKFLTSFGRAGDIAAIVYGGYPLYKSVLQKTGSKEKALEAFQKATLRAQQSGLSSSLSQFQNNPHFRLFLAFKNTANQYFRKMVDATIQYQNGDIDGEQYAKTMSIYALVQPTLYATSTTLTTGLLYKTIGALLKGEWEDDDEDMAQKLFVDALTQIVINPFNAIPLLDDVAAYAARKATGRPVYKAITTPLIDDIEIVVSKLSKKEPTAGDYFVATSAILEPTTAIPISSYYRIVQNIMGKKKKKKYKY